MLRKLDFHTEGMVVAHRMDSHIANEVKVCSLLVTHIVEAEEASRVYHRNNPHLLVRKQEIECPSQ